MYIITIIIMIIIIITIINSRLRNDLGRSNYVFWHPTSESQRLFRNPRRESLGSTTTPGSPSSFKEDSGVAVAQEWCAIRWVRKPSAFRSKSLAESSICSRKTMISWKPLAAMLRRNSETTWECCVTWELGMTSQVCVLFLDPRKSR